MEGSGVEAMEFNATLNIGVYKAGVGIVAQSFSDICLRQGETGGYDLFDGRDSTIQVRIKAANISIAKEVDDEDADEECDGLRNPRVYISGPMSGIPNDNRDVFMFVEGIIIGMNGEPVNPARIPPRQHDGPCPPGPQGESPHAAPCHLRGDIAELVKCDHIIMLPGWENSAGARLELSVAVHCGLNVYYWQPHRVLNKDHREVARFSPVG